MEIVIFSIGNAMKHMRNAKVLVVDDDQAIRQLVCTIVRREQFEVDCAADGVEAIEFLEHHDYAVILLDLMMPRVDGFGVIDYLKHHLPASKPIVLVVTAYADQKFKAVDPDIVAGVLRKPFEVGELGNIIRLCVNGYDNELAHHLGLSKDSAIRKFIQTTELGEDTQH